MTRESRKLLFLSSDKSFKSTHMTAMSFSIKFPTLSVSRIEKNFCMSYFSIQSHVFVSTLMLKGDSWTLSTEGNDSAYINLL